jgi:hypothetical protein
MRLTDSAACVVVALTAERLKLAQAKKVFDSFCAGSYK